MTLHRLTSPRAWTFLLAALFGAIAFTATASAARVDARLLVLRTSDLPTGFKVDRGSTRYWSNAAFANGKSRLRKLASDAGRVSGYSVGWDHGGGAPSRTILSVSDLCRSGAGAHLIFRDDDDEQRRVNAERVKKGGRAYKRRAPAIGNEAALYWSAAGPRFTFLVWRTGRAVLGVVAWGITPEKTVALARLQQRRVETALG